MARRFFVFRFLLLIAAVLALAVPGSALAPWAGHVTGDASQNKFPLLLRPDADVDGDGVSNWEALFGSAVPGSQENTFRYTQWVCSYISELVRRLGMTDPAGGYVSDASGRLIREFGLTLSENGMAVNFDVMALGPNLGPAITEFYRNHGLPAAVSLPAEDAGPPTADRTVLSLLPASLQPGETWNGGTTGATITNGEAFLNTTTPAYQAAISELAAAYQFNGYFLTTAQYQRLCSLYAGWAVSHLLLQCGALSSMPADPVPAPAAPPWAAATGAATLPYPTAAGSDTSTLSREYIRGSDMGGGVGGMLYSKAFNGGAVAHCFAVSNARGDVTTQTDEAGAVTWQAAYEAFGTRTAEAGTNHDPQRANTKDEDPTGLLNEGFRYRDLEAGVFISRDPAGFVDGPNVYCYVVQNPWTSFDPEGLMRDDRAFPQSREQHAKEIHDRTVRYWATHSKPETAMLVLPEKDGVLRHYTDDVINESQKYYISRLDDLENNKKLFQDDGWITRDINQRIDAIHLFMAENEVLRGETKFQDDSIKGAEEDLLNASLAGGLAKLGLKLAFKLGTKVATTGSRLTAEALAKIESKVAAKGGVPALREAYIREVHGVSQAHQQMLEAGFSEQTIARTLHQMRRDIGVKYKELTPAAELERITARNIRDYGDPLGPTIDFYRSRGDSWQQIIESAARPGGKNLGLDFPVPRDPLPALNP